MVIFSLLLPSKKISKPLLSPKVCFARFCDSLVITASTDLILYFKCGHTQMQLMWVVFFLETQAKKHFMFIPHGPTPCLPQDNSAHLSLLGFSAGKKALLNKFTNKKEKKGLSETTGLKMNLILQCHSHTFLVW